VGNDGKPRDYKGLSDFNRKKMGVFDSNFDNKLLMTLFVSLWKGGKDKDAKKH